MLGWEEQLRRRMGLKLSGHNLVFGQNVRYQGFDYRVYDHDETPSGSTLVLVRCKPGRDPVFLRGIDASEVK